jgi:hypothetical protein
MTSWVLALCLLTPMQQQAPQAGQAASGTAPSKRIEVDGQVSVLADVLPRRDVAELRPQASVDATWRTSTAVRMKFEGFVEALAARRGGGVTDAAVRVREAWIEAAGPKGDLRAGFGRLVWGRLDEVQPSDVINPLDTARFLFDGRSAARLPVAFIRGRAFVSESTVIEGVLAPVFRSGTFDELDESSSPFNLLNDLVLPAAIEISAPGVARLKPSRSWRNVSGGGRISGTLGKVDVSAGAFRGFDGFGLVSFEAESIAPAVVGRLVERFPRFTTVSADFETVSGEWAWRGEAAMFVEKTLNSPNGPVKGRAVDAGLGLDRRTGNYRVFLSGVVHREWSPRAPGIDRTDLNLVGSIERHFSRERYFARAFGVMNPADASAFVRGLFIFRMRDDFALEFSAAAFVGTGDDTLARFHGRDFLLTRLRWRY